MRRPNQPTKEQQERLELEARLAVDKAFINADREIGEFRYRIFKAFTRRVLGYETFDRILSNY